jgi:beta-lactam-binding protein with PASTA domain
MRALRVVVGLAIVLGIAGCGSDKTPVMPDVTGKKLDVAKSAIKDAGFEDEVKVDGGGVFGVVKESNWEVCDQSPAAGAAVSGAPRLMIDRSCRDDAEPSETSTPNEPASESEEPDPTTSSEPEADQVLTKSNSEEFAAVLRASDYCDESVGSFAADNSGRTIEFDGSIADMAPHGDADTRYDILVAPGNKGPESVAGPAFKFEDVNVFDLKLTGTKIPDSVGEGDRFRFVAEIVEYNQTQCLLFLEPVETKIR